MNRKTAIGVGVTISLFAISSLLFFSLRTKRTIEPAEFIRDAIAKAGGEAALNAEVDRALSGFNGDSPKLFTPGEEDGIPVIGRLSGHLGGEILGIWPSGSDGVGIPAHVRIRFGDHFSYVFILLTGTSSNLDAMVQQHLKPSGKGIYWRSSKSN